MVLEIMGKLNRSLTTVLSTHKSCNFVQIRIQDILKGKIKFDGFINKLLCKRIDYSIANYIGSNKHSIITFNCSKVYKIILYISVLIIEAFFSERMSEIHEFELLSSLAKFTCKVLTKKQKSSVNREWTTHSNE